MNSPHSVTSPATFEDRFDNNTRPSSPRPAYEKIVVHVQPTAAQAPIPSYLPYVPVVQPACTGSVYGTNKGAICTPAATVTVHPDGTRVEKKECAYCGRLM
ncbi:hypothetical protein M231_07527 [Tremella mesenterica]|uniref:Uncharacterized protein n=1 Tax=Tremella mesenterica TaxID=5217 RepID=A0A4Q1BC28_TREME|nr:hypothetical protein M231_07527 [Tremella mesenterica]